MSYFTKIGEGEVAVLVKRGTYSQAPLYSFQGGLYAKVGAGFVRLSLDKSTSVPDVRVEVIIHGGTLYMDSLRRLRVDDVRGGRALTAAESLAVKSSSA